ncbi:uracil-xanthine permease [Caballeronia sp. EK]|jgi:uracil-xanthine permease|uniref:uracil-xanthine permease family protein n=1 Tax=Caballeronia sp. EK TaxID=2767469 RepID=UPI000459E27B|nr:uracil-xanthine permease family protein [Caballeronia sp. EK]KAK49318.1 nucleobase:cation symporter [Caballeronia jiangsuensis]MBC8635573.1 uracil-xanthine permease [Caballeronia sp. EK]
MAHHPPVHAVDERLPLAKLVLFGLQHVLVVAASPITAVFLVAKALGLSSALTVDLISATFLVCGLGTLLQSFGPLKFGARLPFIMVPGGAPVVLFVLIAQQTNLQTAAGATILTGLFYFLLLPVFARCLRFFPRIVIGTMLILVAVNLIRIYGVVIVGTPGTAEFGSPLGIGLALATVGFTVLFAKLFKGMLGQLAVLLGLFAGAALAWALGVMSFADVWNGALVTLPTPLPFGMPRFDVLAALPLIIFSVISMAEATGQTVAIAEVVGKEIDPQTEVPKTIRGDALMSVLGGLFGTSLIITSSENIGIVQATGVRSRFVTAAAGVLLVVIALLAPLGRLANAIPAPVVGGTALIVFSIIGVMGINLLRQVELRSRANMYTLAAALTMGVLPIVVPGVYSRFPAALQIVLGNGLAMGALTAVLVNALFAHLNLDWRERRAADPAAHLEAAVNDNRSCH